jgi:hypothetical protein
MCGPILLVLEDIGKFSRQIAKGQKTTFTLNQAKESILFNLHTYDYIFKVI